MNRKLTCIICPIGCTLKVLYDEKEIQSVQGNLCPRGMDHAEKELFNPERTLTTSVRVRNGEMPLASVRSVGPLPKALIRPTVKRIKRMELDAPVEFGQVVLEDVEGTGVDVVATREVKRKESKKR